MAKMLTQELKDDLVYSMEDRMDNVYTHGLIIEAWEDYKTKMMMKVLKDGKWHVRDMDAMKPGAVLPEDCTKAEVCKAKDCISFPRFLKRFYA